ncbi:butyrophilin-like protein 9 isoform X6 [Oenanthe melanoleuca]|uniref:butyrophilin-like protein 9 isoform X6 n=1 Tax=Oenanthe melanoleuca TaxID=2939378 RepID=UPI0024C14274|nr:butyrophilin-like protein 9 isoform X6 [Oenanthe melanoleuca]
MGSGMGSGIPTPLLLLLLSVLHPIIGNVPEPLLVLEGRDRAGIRLRCVPERPFPQIRLLWSGAGGENLTGIAEPEGSGSAGNTGNTGSAGISLLLRPGSGNAASCRALDPQLGAAAESSVVIADVFFPGTSPWVAALALLLLLALSLALAAALRLRRDNQILAQERKSQQQIQEEIEELRMELEEEMGKFQRESQDMAARIDFRRAQSHAAGFPAQFPPGFPARHPRGQGSRPAVFPGGIPPAWREAAEEFRALPCARGAPGPGAPPPLLLRRRGEAAPGICPPANSGESLPILQPRKCRECSGDPARGGLKPQGFLLLKIK